MNIYFDESGNTGCLLTKKELLNFQEQPIFALGAVVVDSEDEQLLRNKYIEFKNKFGIQGEIKGSELVTRNRNAELEYFIQNLLDEIHFSVILYDKRFYLCTLLLRSFTYEEFYYEEMNMFYELASMYSLQRDEFFIKYCEYIEHPTVESFHDYLLFLKSYEYCEIAEEWNLIKSMAERILDDQMEVAFVDDFMTFGWYDDESITNLINLNALSELIYFIKSDKPFENNSINYIHDAIHEFEPTFQNELKEYNIDLSFKDSKDEILLQLADNLAGVMCHAYKRIVKHFKKEEEWLTNAEWDMSLAAKLFRVISTKNIKFTVPLHDWAAALCVEIMFSNDYPKTMRKNLYFNRYYTQALLQINESIFSQKNDIAEVDMVLER